MGISLADQTGLAPAMKSLRRSSAVDVSPSLRALVLLGGSVRPSHLSRSIGRSLLDLPVEPGLSVLQLWEHEADRLAKLSGSADMPMRVVLDRAALEPSKNGSAGVVRVSLERESNEFRGTGGVLRDLAGEYGPDEMLLVASGGQILVEPLAELAGELLSQNADVALVGHSDGTPGGVFVANTRILSDLRDIGFLDFKEQVLPRLASSGTRVRVVQRAVATGFPVRNLDSYIGGLRAYYKVKAGKGVAADPFEEDWSPTFSLVEKGATVDPGATIHDSVVLDGGRVERGAVVVRSIVCPGGVVRSGEAVAGQIVASERTMRKSR
jgi:hypothetical protein